MSSDGKGMAPTHPRFLGSAVRRPVAFGHLMGESAEANRRYFFGVAAPTALQRLLVHRRTDDVALIPLVSPTTHLGAASSSSATVNFGFTFRFGGVEYTSGNASARGRLRLAGTSTTSVSSTLFDPDGNVMIAPWFDRLETADSVGYLKSETQGTAPLRRCVIEWYCEMYSGQSAANYDRAKFQLVLYETWDRMEFRYGSLESGGSPSFRASYSAAIGFKADTTTTPTNLRNLSVDDMDLGGSATTATSNLRACDAGGVIVDWPSWTWVIEPNWPMTGRIIRVREQDLTGFQDPYADPFAAIANNINWLYCNHCPPLVNIAPSSNAGHTAPTLVVPVEPSADNLTYRVWIETYHAAGGALTCAISRDAAADPQPGTAADWSAIDTLATSAAAGYHSWTEATIRIPSDVTALRFVFSNSVQALNILVAPVPLAEIDPTATYGSDFEPMAIGQVRQQGGAIHPEFLNRGWRNVARILADRRQMLWAYCTIDNSDYGYSGSTGRPSRIFGFSPSCIKGWHRQTATAVIYARDTSDGGKLTVTERGGNSVTFTVDDNGGEYRLQSSSLELLSDEPTILAPANPMATMRPMFVGLTWAPALADYELIRGTVPIPKLTHIAAVVSRIERALRAYAMTGLARLLDRSGGNKWVMSWLVPTGVKALRAKIGRIDKDEGGTIVDTSIYADSSGAGAVNEILIPGPDAGSNNLLPDQGALTVVGSSYVYDTAPAAAMDRLLESPTLGTLTGAVREKVELLYGYGATLVPITDSDAI